MNPNILLALQIAFDLLKHATDLQALLGRALSEGRDITDAELATIASASSLAGARLDQAIKDVEPATPEQSQPQT